MGQPRFLIVSRPARPGTVGGDAVWRLLGANNRHLGQGGEPFRDVPGCLTAIDSLRLGLDRGRPSIAPVDHGQLWRWRLDLDGRTVACSTRAYRRQRECQDSLARFLAGASSAEPALLAHTASALRPRSTA
ncbi:hypothetical protein KSNIM_25240 [Kitasatospora sp. DSM 101779]|nr:hypothetical protein [Kitasatospora sp. DSM 101779]MCU7824884.1 hypothetical protein [Kitasatospora sp. DSM 101779]